MPPPLPQLAGVEHRDVDVRGVRLHVAEAGEGDPVLLVHGWPQHWWSWRELIPSLAERHRVIAPDLRGLGWSGAPADGDYRKETLADDLLGLIDALGFDRVRYVGHDWGAWLGYLIALREPARIDRLVTISVPGPWPPPGGITLRRAVRFAYQWPIAAPLPPPVKHRYFERVFHSARKVGSWTDAELDTYMAPLREPQGRRASTGFYRDFQRREILPIARGRYGGQRLTVPTLFMIGDRDLLYNEELIDLLRENADDVEIEVVGGAGHFLPEERPDLVRERVAGFLAKAGSTASPA